MTVSVLWFEKSVLEFQSFAKIDCVDIRKIILKYTFIF